MYKVLFLCTGNSARSQMAEVVLNKFSKGKYVAYSAGSEPKDTVDPVTLKVLGKSGYAISHTYGALKRIFLRNGVYLNCLSKITK